MSEIFLNPNSIYRHSQANFLLNKDQLFAFATAVSGLNNSIYGIQPSPGMMVSGFTLSDIFAINPLSTNSSLCANVYLLDNNMDALKFFASRPFVVYDGGVRERDRNARNPLAVYLTPVNLTVPQDESLESEEATENNVSDYNDYYEWIFVLPESISSWEDISQIYISAETDPNFRLSSIDGGKWELIGTTSWTDEKLSNMLDDVNGSIQDVRNALENFVPLSGNAEVSGVLSIENRIVISDNSIGNACTIIDKALGIQTNIDSNVASAYFETGYSPDYIDLFKEDHVSETSSALILEYPYDEAQILGESSNTALNKTLATREWTDKNFVELLGDEVLSGDLSVSHKFPNPSYAYNNKIVLSSSYGTPNEMYMYCFEENPITTLQRDSGIVYSVISGIWDQNANRYLRCEERKLTAQADINIFDNENYTKNAVATIQLSAPWIHEYSQPKINIEAYEVPSELTYNLSSVQGLIQLQYTSGSFYRFMYADMKGFNDTQNVGGQDGIDAVYAYFDSCWVYEIPEFIEEIDRFALMTDIMSSIEPINILLSTDFPKVSADAINALKEKKFVEWQLSSDNLFAGKNNVVETGTRPTDAPHHNIVFGRNNVLSNQYEESDWYGYTGRINKTIVIGNDNSIKGRSEPFAETIDISYNVIGNNNSISTDGVLTSINFMFDKNLEIFGNNLSVFNSNNSIILGNDFKASNVSKKMIVGSSNAFELVDLENGNIPYARLSANITGQALGILNSENKIADGLVITSSMLSNSINGDRIESNTMSGAKIKSGTISGEKLQDGSITTNKLRDNAVTPAKLDRAYIPLSSKVNVETPFVLSQTVSNGSNIVSGCAISVQLNTDGSSTIALGNGKANYNGAIAIGGKSSATINNAIAIGYNANSYGTNAIQLGAGTNQASNTLQFRSYPLFKANGDIVEDRISNSVSAYVSKSDLSSALLDLSNVVDFNYDSIENENSILSLAHNVGVLQTVLFSIQQLLS